MMQCLKNRNLFLRESFSVFLFFFQLKSQESYFSQIFFQQIFTKRYNAITLITYNIIYIYFRCQRRIAAWTQLPSLFFNFLFKLNKPFFCQHPLLPSYSSPLLFLKTYSHTHKHINIKMIAETEEITKNSLILIKMRL